MYSVLGSKYTFRGVIKITEVHLKTNEADIKTDKPRFQKNEMCSKTTARRIKKMKTDLNKMIYKLIKLKFNLKYNMRRYVAMTQPIDDGDELQERTVITIVF